MRIMCVDTSIDIDTAASRFPVCPRVYFPKMSHVVVEAVRAFVSRFDQRKMTKISPQKEFDAFKQPLRFSPRIWAYFLSVISNSELRILRLYCWLPWSPNVFQAFKSACTQTRKRSLSNSTFDNLSDILCQYS